MNGGVGVSQQPPPAFSGPTATEELLALHTAHLVIVVPGELCPGSDTPAHQTRQINRGIGAVFTHSTWRNELK